MLLLSDSQLHELKKIYQMRARRALKRYYTETLTRWIACDETQAADWFDYIEKAVRILPNLRDSELVALAELARLEGTGSVECPAYRRCCQKSNWPMRALWLRGQLSIATPDTPFLTHKI